MRSIDPSDLLEREYRSTGRYSVIIRSRVAEADKAAKMEKQEQQEGNRKMKDKQGILLYYYYVEISSTDSVVDWYKNNCNALDLLGRVRVSPEGVNVTIGGTILSLEKHIAAVNSNPVFEIHNCDFKMAPCDEPIDSNVARECGFTSLSVRVVKDVVTLFSHPPEKMPSVSVCGKHLSPSKFHLALQLNDPSSLSEGEADIEENSKIVVLDARNVYETRIGKFVPPKGIQCLDPNIRQYSDLPGWIDGHEEELRGNHILMYCTGGVRCEMASAYIKMKGPDFKNVYQLSGGIQRYLEAYRDGGFFKGKNFVFDHRISVASLSTEVTGSCMLCHKVFDDYSSRCRCFYCRMLVLVCKQCQESCASNEMNPAYVCELCQKDRCSSTLECKEEEKAGASPRENDHMVCIDKSEETTEQQNLKMSSRGPFLSEGSSIDNPLAPKRLKILCLHGFRQNGMGLKGRLSSFSKKLKKFAEFVFVDAPHELPFIYQPLHNQSQRTMNNYHSLEPLYDSFNLEKSKFPQQCRKKRAWLIAPSLYRSQNVDFPGSLGSTVEGDEDTDKTNWIAAASPFDPFQYQQQTGGWSETINCLEDVFLNLGPFDGVLGFSQGASVAAALSILKQIPGYKTNMDFNFVILCSGFPSLIEEFQKFIHNPKMLPIHLSSLHIYGGCEGSDRQIASDASMQLASYFNPERRVILEHTFGHIVPTQTPYIDKVKDFVSQFL